MYYSSSSNTSSSTSSTMSHSMLDDLYYSTSSTMSHSMLKNVCKQRKKNWWEKGKLIKISKFMKEKKQINLWP